MQSNNRSSVKSEQQSSSLKIADVRPEDAGSYTLFVRNRRGSTQHTIQLSVVGEALFLSFLGMALDKNLKAEPVWICNFRALKAIPTANGRINCLLENSSTREMLETMAVCSAPGQ